MALLRDILTFLAEGFLSDDRKADLILQPFLDRYYRPGCRLTELARAEINRRHSALTRALSYLESYRTHRSSGSIINTGSLLNVFPGELDACPICKTPNGLTEYDQYEGSYSMICARFPLGATITVRRNTSETYHGTR